MKINSTQNRTDDNTDFFIKQMEMRRELFEDNRSLPLIPMRGMSVFPGMVVHFDIGRDKSILALETAMTQDQIVFLSEQKDIKLEDPMPEDIYEVGCVAKVKQMLKMPDDLTRILVEVVERATIVEYVQYNPYFEVVVRPVQTIYHDSKENRTLIRMIRTAFGTYMNMTRKMGMDLLATLDLIKDPDQLVDLICANLLLDATDAQRILQETDLEKRLMITYETLINELEMLRIEQNIDAKVKSELDKNQREYVLREQIKVIQEELGEVDIVDEVDDYRSRLEEMNLPEEVRAKVTAEINRLNKIPPGSQEAGVIESYVETVLDLPWGAEAEETLDVAGARVILDHDHYALDKVKERILEYISVLELSKAQKSQIICLVGPPGVGKTSIAKSIARALNRPYVRMSLGGLRDEAEIRGHRRTYVGSIPGRIIYHIKQAGVKNPLFLLDEIDKLSQDFRGDPASALLEVLDPEQNATFTDNYLELPFDLSKVMFLTTANSLNTIPRPLLDRMEVIEVNGYVESEKLEIAKRYLIPKQLEIHGLQSGQCKISAKALQNIVNFYTRESGVRELERKIAQICRVTAKEIVEHDKKMVSVSQKNLQKYLGIPRYSHETMEKAKEVGLVNGLAWTAVGGETLQIEVVVVPGTGKINITGQLGDVMQESAKAGISYIRSQVEALGIEPDFYTKKDIHLHVPEGAVPKDGPSAGITMTTALISALTGKPVSQELAMTGEITIRGRVLPVGGLREKLTAATRAGIKEIYLSKENKKDLEEVPEVVLDALKIHYVSSMAEIIKPLFGVKK